MAAPKLKTALPSVSAPLVDRYRNVTPVWYPWLQRVVQFIDGIASGELIVDGAITSRTIQTGAITAEALDAGAVTAGALAAGAVTAGNIAAGAVTTEAIAAGAITADSGIIEEAAIGTLQLAGNSVTQAVAAYSGTQVQLSSASYVTLATLSMTITGTQPTIVWGTLLAGGARIGSFASHDFVYDGNYWLNNASTSFITTRVVIGGTASNENREMSVLAANALNIPFAHLFSGLSPGAATVSIQAKLVSGSAVGIRDVNLAALEVKR